MSSFQDIPTNWQSKKLEEIVLKTRLGGNYSGAEKNTGIPLIKMGNLARGNICVDKIEYLEPGAQINDEDELKLGDLLLNTRNTLELVGKVAIWRNELDSAVYNSNIMKLDFDENCVESNEFMNLVFNSRHCLKQLRHRAIGTTSVAAIYWRDLKSIKISLPPHSEQRKIIELLGWWDQAIDQTGKLIEAKQQFKKVLVQQLLTGKRRFEDFVKTQQRRETQFGDVPADWDDLEIGDIARELSKRNAQQEPLPVLSCTKYDGLVDSLSYFGKRIFSEDTSNYKVVKRGQFAYATNHIEEGSIGLLDSVDAGLVSPMYTVFATKEGVHAPFLFKLLKTDLYIHIFQTSTNASVNRRGSLRWKQFSKIKIALPSLEEQVKISDCIDTFDKEIQLLSDLQDAYKKQKKWLMQKLLTGKVRVPITE